MTSPAKMIRSLVMIVFSDMTTLQQRGKYQGLLETNIALGNGIGPIIGGAFSGSSATWRWAFWFIVPVTVAAGTSIFFTLPQPKMNGRTTDKIKMIDYGGTILSLGCVVFLLVNLHYACQIPVASTDSAQIPLSSGGSTWAWRSPLVISFFIIGFLMAIAFVLYEWQVAKYPVMPIRLFERRTAKIMFSHNFITGIVYYSDLYFLPLYFQVVMGHSPLLSGVLILPLILGFSAASASAGFILSRLGRCNPVIWAGYVLWTAGAGTHIAFGSSTSIGTTVGCLILEGVGIGFSMQPVMIALLANTRKEDRAVVTGLRNFLRTVGGAIGLAACTAIVNNAMRENLPAAATGRNVLELLGMLDTLTASDQQALKHAYMKGLRIIFYLACPLIGACLLSSVFMSEVPLATAHDKYKIKENTDETKSKDGDDSKGEIHGKNEISVAATPEKST
jgi:MFS family permease